MKNLRINVLAILAIITISSCSKDDEVAPVVPPAVNEEEVITTVNTFFIPSSATGGDVVTLTYRDLDGDGPNAPVVTVSGPFALNKTYNGFVQVLNETVTPAANISTEILAEAADHQFFYQRTGTLPAFVYTPVAAAADNYDSNGKPLGYKTTFVTGATGSTGTLTVTLRHLGDKSKPNVATGDITNATGATDFAVTYTGLIVQ